MWLNYKIIKTNPSLNIQIWSTYMTTNSGGHVQIGAAKYLISCQIVCNHFRLKFRNVGQSIRKTHIHGKEIYHFVETRTVTNKTSNYKKRIEHNGGFGCQQSIPDRNHWFASCIPNQQTSHFKSSTGIWYVYRNRLRSDGPTHKHTHTRAHTHVHIYIYIYMYAYIYTYTYIHMHMHTCRTSINNI